MTLRRIGDLAVFPVGLGCAGFSLDHADDPARAERTVRTAVDAGITLLDTALAYTPAGQDNHNERLLRRILAGLPDRDRIVVATKGGHCRDGDTFPIDGRPSTLAAHCASSLRALGVDRIDLYHLHHPDPAVPIEESVGALVELRDAGHIAHIGVSNVSLDQLRRAQRVAPIASVQNKLSIHDRANLDVAEHCFRTGVAFLAYSPLGGSGRSSGPVGTALTWLLELRPNVIPVVGATRPRHAGEAAAAGL
ncbi:MAG TPA: aldo/keto reductase [Pseudonocardiaceae bacterium]|nr:aldo/keto reductase [Pseudonocardiaceae bacterium]